MRHERNRTVGILAQRQARFDRKTHASDFGITGYKRRLAVAEHTIPASGLTQVFDLYAPKALERFAIDLRFVDRPIPLILSFLRLFGFGRCFRHLLRCGLFVLGRIDLVRCKHIPKADRVF